MTTPIIVVSGQAKQAVELRSYEPEPATLGSTQAPFPTFTVRLYAEKAATEAVVDQMEDGRFFAEVEGIKGVWADGETAEEALAALPAAIYEWAVLKIQDQDRDMPVVAGINLNVI